MSNNVETITCSQSHQTKLSVGVFELNVKADTNVSTRQRKKQRKLYKKK